MDVGATSKDKMNGISVLNIVARISMPPVNCGPYLKFASHSDRASEAARLG